MFFGLQDKFNKPQLQLQNHLTLKKIRLPFSGVPYPGQKQDGAEPQLGKKVKKIYNICN